MLFRSLDRFMMRLSSTARVPVTVLFGRSPAGMNATGQSDLDNFYNEIKASQRSQLRPRLTRLIRLLMLSRKGPTNGKDVDSWEVKFNPLEQQSPLEEAQEYNERATADSTYVRDGVLLPEEVAQSRFTEVGYSRQINIDEDLRRKEETESDAINEAIKRMQGNGSNPQSSNETKSSTEESDVT